MIPIVGVMVPTSLDDCTLVSSGRIWPVVIIPIVTALDGIVLSMWHGTRMASDRSLQGQCGVPVLIRVGTLGWARPLPVPSRGRDGGEVMRLSSVVWLRHEGGVMANPSLSV